MQTRTLVVLIGLARGLLASWMGSRTPAAKSTASPPMTPWVKGLVKWFGIGYYFFVALILVSAGAIDGNVQWFGLGVAMFAMAVIFWRVGKRNERDQNNARLVLVVEDDM